MLDASELCVKYNCCTKVVHDQRCVDFGNVCHKMRLWTKKCSQIFFTQDNCHKPPTGEMVVRRPTCAYVLEVVVPPKRGDEKLHSRVYGTQEGLKDG